MSRSEFEQDLIDRVQRSRVPAVSDWRNRVAAGPTTRFAQRFMVAAATAVVIIGGGLGALVTHRSQPNSGATATTAPHSTGSPVAVTLTPPASGSPAPSAGGPSASPRSISSPTPSPVVPSCIAPAVGGVGIDATVADVAAAKADGASWVRFDIGWADAEPGRGQFDFSAYIPTAQAAAAQHLNVLIALNQPIPAWEGNPGGSGSHNPPANAQDYADFVAATVRTFAPLGVDAYELWYSPNDPQFWGGNANPAQYAAILAAAYPAAHAADAKATVITGTLAPQPGANNPARFLAAMYAAGARFDALGVMPNNWTAAPQSQYDSFYAVYHSPDGTLPSLHDVMVSNHDPGKIWVVGYGAPTASNDPQTPAVSTAQQASLITNVLSTFSGFAWAGPVLVTAEHDGTTQDPYDNMGLRTASGQAKPALSAFQQSKRSC